MAYFLCLVEYENEDTKAEELCPDETAGNCCDRYVHTDTLMAHEMARGGLM